MKQVSNLWTKRAFARSTYSRLVAAGFALVAALAASAQAQDDRMSSGSAAQMRTLPDCTPDATMFRLAAIYVNHPHSA